MEKAKKKLKKYFKENKLDPNKDYTKDKEHGTNIKKYMKTIEAGRIQLGEVLSKDPKSKTKLKDRKDLREEDPTKPKKESKKKTVTRAVKYDYPKVTDGKGKEREMTPQEKKKYRAEMRKQSDEPTDKKKSGKEKEKKSKEIDKKDAKKSSKVDKKSDKDGKKEKSKDKGKKDKKAKSGPKDD